MAKIKPTSMVDKFDRLHKRAVESGMSYHSMMVGVCNILRDHGVEPETVINMMRTAAEKVTRRDPSTGEIENVVGWSYRNNSFTQPKSWEAPSKETKVDQAVIDAWSSKGDLQALMKRSKPIPSKAEEILGELYGPDDLLHISPDIFQDRIKAQRDWITDGLNDMQFICPSSFKEVGMGRVADNVSDRKYLVFETDDLPKKWDAQCGLISRLSQELPCIMVVFSGNKSLHSWHDASTINKEKLQRFSNLVVTLGGDQSVLRKSQLVRFPGGRNAKTGETQKVIFYGR